jgi:DNA-binding XRE family transcriptional regulator
MALYSLPTAAGIDDVVNRHKTRSDRISDTLQARSGRAGSHQCQVSLHAKIGPQWHSRRMEEGDVIKAIAGRLKAVRCELKKNQTEMAKWVGVGRPRYVGWESAANFPDEMAMIRLCAATGLTMDYIYRGKLDGVPLALAIRVRAREKGMDPDAADFQPEQALAAL